MTLRDLPEIGHIGFICGEVDSYKTLFESERVKVYDFIPTRAWLHGAEMFDCQLHIALYTPKEGPRMEFIQYISGTDLEWKVFFDKHGAGIHHIAYYVKNYDEWREYFRTKPQTEVIFEAEIEDKALGKRRSFYAKTFDFPSLIEISTYPTNL